MLKGLRFWIAAKSRGKIKQKQSYLIGSSISKTSSTIQAHIFNQKLTSAASVLFNLLLEIISVPFNLFYAEPPLKTLL
jgi:hypothetical protein